MAKVVQLRRGTSAEHNNFTGAPGEVTVDTDLNTLRVHNGETPGGTILARRDDVANLAMPGTRFIDMELGPNGTTYVAPAAGYIYIQGMSTSSSAALEVVVNGGYAIYQPAAYDASRIRTLVPISKGSIFSLGWINVNIDLFRFVYTNS